MKEEEKNVVTYKKNRVAAEKTQRYGAQKWEMMKQAH